MTVEGGVHSFPSRHRIRSRRDFLRARSSGKVIRSSHFTILLLEKENGPTRLGITASRKVGGAVQRNRVKRLVREFFRINYSEFPRGLDISVIAKPGAASLAHSQVHSELTVLTRIAGQNNR